MDETRHRIEDRLDSLSRSLSPGELLDHALGVARRHGGEFGGNLGRQVKQNPVPLILTGIGLSWLMMSSQSRGYQYPVSASASTGDSSALKDKAGSAMNRAGGAMQEGAERARQAKGSVQERAHSAAASMEGGARSAQEQMTDFFQQQPVLAGSLGVALGAALGSLLPHSETEDSLMGSVSDEAKAKAKEAGSEQYEKARERSEEVLQAARGQQDSSSRSAPSPSSSGNQSDTPRV